MKTSSSLRLIFYSIFIFKIFYFLFLMVIVNLILGFNSCDIIELEFSNNILGIIDPEIVCAEVEPAVESVVLEPVLETVVETKTETKTDSKPEIKFKAGQEQNTNTEIIGAVILFGFTVACLNIFVDAVVRVLYNYFRGNSGTGTGTV
jgi:hypothetical protein